MYRYLLVIALAGALAGCGAAEPKWASDADVARAYYVHPGPKSVTLYTVVSTQNGSGAHSGLLINASQRVMFDPAGSWTLPQLAERNDVHHGMTDKMVNFYIDYHARETYDVIEQTLEVPPGVAELVMQRAKAYGAVPKAHCTDSISEILRGVPGFETLPNTMFPKKLMRGFADLPGVHERVITDDDADDNHGILLVQSRDVDRINADLQAGNIDEAMAEAKRSQETARSKP